MFDKVILILTIEKTISKKISVKASATKPSGNHPPRYKTLEIEQKIRFYAKEYGDDTGEGEEVEILIVYDSSLVASKQNLVNRKFTYIYTFDNGGQAGINAMRNITVGVFEHLETTSPIDVDKMISYTQLIPRGDALKKKTREVLVTCRKLAKEIAGDEWILGELTGLFAEDFGTWMKTDTTGYDGHDYLDLYKCVDFVSELWFELGKCMWRKHFSVYQDHMKYVYNDIVKPFKVKIILYAKRVRKMYDLAQYPPLPSTKGESLEADHWTVRNQEFTASDFQFEIKDGLPKTMHCELDDHREDYCSLTSEDWCDLLSIVEVKDENKRSAVQIKNIYSARAASLSDSNKYARITRKKREMTGVLRPNKSQKKAHKHHGIQRYYALFKKAGMPEQKYMVHRDKYCTGVRTNRNIKDGMGGSVVSINDTVKHYNKSEANGRRI